MSVAVRFVEAPSVLDGVPAAAWHRFEDALKVQPYNMVSRHGGIGAYDIRPRRLVEIGRAVNFRRVGFRQECDFILPWTTARFLTNPVAQRAVFVKSMRLYHEALRRGEIVRPDDVSMSGALAILHAGGLGALRGWPKLINATKALYEVTKGLF